MQNSSPACEKHSAKQEYLGSSEPAITMPYWPLPPPPQQQPSSCSRTECCKVLLGIPTVVLQGSMVCMLLARTAAIALLDEQWKLSRVVLLLCLAASVQLGTQL
jgi:hypothetical protein